MLDLNKIAQEIREILEKKRKEYKLDFEEEGHIYTMLNSNGELKSDWESVSTVEKIFYDEFDAEQKALDMCFGDRIKQQILLNEWASKGDYATNKGSRVHYELEKYAITKFNMNKVVRMPIFECDDQQMLESDNMIAAGKKFIDLMDKRGCLLVETEVTLGSPELGFVGQGDNLWVTLNKDKNSIGFVWTDHKTNAIKNLEPKVYNGYLKPPFEKYRDYAITHYYIQLSLYSKLLLDMMKGTKYENTPILGCILDSLRDDGSFQEYRVPKPFTDLILDINLKNYTK